MLRNHYLMGWVFALLIFTSCKKETVSPKNWKQISTGTTDRLNKILFVNDTLGFVVGGERFYSSIILKTTDGGHSFQLHSITESGKGNYGMALRPDGVLVVVGFDSKYITSSDLGNSWQVKQLGTWRPIKDVGFFNAHEGIIIDGHSFLSGAIYQIDADGNTLHRDSVNYEMNDLEITSNGYAYVAATGAIIRSVNKGINWEFLPVKNDNFIALDFINDQEAWACGTEGSIVQTTDGGNHWNYLRKGNKMAQKKYHFQDILFVNSQHGYVVGEKGTLLKTIDGGLSWSSIETQTTQHLRQISLCPNGDLLICGDGGLLFRMEQ